jgi:hypothetical protein
MTRLLSRSPTFTQLENRVTALEDADPTVANVRLLGGVTDGSADSRAAFVLADSIGAITVPRGSYLIGSDLTLTNDIFFAPGAMLVIPDGVTVTLNGHVDAGIQQIFACSGTGKVVLGLSKNYIGFAEWWGAITNNSTSPVKLANDAAISAAIVACPVVQLLSNDYFLSATLKITTSHRILRGVGKHWSAIGDCTRLIGNVATPTADIVQIGPDTNPGGGPNSFVQEVHITDLSIVRDGVPTGNAVYKTCPAGLRFQFCLYCSGERLWIAENSIGVMFAGAVQTRVREVFSFRSLPGHDPANDPFFGFFYDGSAAIGLAGGNASVYETDCNTAVGGSPALTISAHSYGYLGYTDWFVERPESTATQYGIVLDGTGASGTGTQDISISHSVFDQCLISGYKILGGGAQTIINIDDPYVALNTGSTTGVAAFDIESNAGIIDITGGQILGGLATTGDVGFKIVNSSGVSVRGTLIRECKAPVQISGSSNCDINPRVNNPTVGTSGAGAIAVTGTNSHLRFSPNITGGAGVFGPGVSFAGTTTTDSTVDVSGIDPTSCTGGTKFSCNGTAVTTAGAVNTNCLAQGNFN